MEMIGVTRSQALSPNILSPLLVFSAEESILAGTEESFKTTRTKTTTTTKTTASRLEKLKQRKIKFGTKLMNFHPKPVESQGRKVISQPSNKPQNSSTQQVMDQTIKFNFVEDVTVKEKSNLSGITKVVPLMSFSLNLYISSSSWERAESIAPSDARVWRAWHSTHIWRANCHWDSESNTITYQFNN